MRPGLARRIERFKKAIERLKRISGLSPEEYINTEAHVLAEREIQVAVEALIDLGHAIISEKGWETPSSYRAVALILGRHGVLNREDTEVMVRLAGLRNVIVHMYAEIDHKKVYRELSYIVKSSTKIMAQLLGYMEKEGIDPEID